MKAHQRIIKRATDLAISSLVLALSSPLFLLLLLAVRLDSPSGALFRQARVGRNGKLFTIYKLRTMVANAADLRNPDGSTFNAEDDPRITSVGRFLRRTSLDELPQLVNVLKGDMSLVGPRPDLPDQVRLYPERYRKRLSVRPGITGWAIIHGRNSLPWETRRELDVQYVESYSLWLDCLILLRTVALVLARKGVYIPPPAHQSSFGSKDARS